MLWHTNELPCADRPPLIMLHSGEGSSSEDTSDEAYAYMHKLMEDDERRRYAAAAAAGVYLGEVWERWG